MASIPVIDISPLLATPDQKSDSTALSSVLSAWDNAFRTVGFAVITGHGVDSSLPDGLHAAAREFFTQPLENKLRYHRGELDGFRRGGYSEVGSSAASRTMEGSGAVITPPDLVEGYTHVPSESGPSDLPPQLRDPILAYCAQMRRLLTDVMRLSALALGLEGDYFSKYYTGDDYAFRLAYYPPQVESNVGSMPVEGQVRTGAHTDFLGFTLLRQDPTLSGLEIFIPHAYKANSQEGEWIPVPLVPNSFVINAGDLIQRWTNGLWRSSLHRVVNPPPKEASSARLSMVFFTGPGQDTVVEPMEECVQRTGGQSLHEPVTTKEYLLQKMQMLQTAYKSA